MKRYSIDCNFIGGLFHFELQGRTEHMILGSKFVSIESFNQQT